MYTKYNTKQSVCYAYTIHIYKIQYKTECIYEYKIHIYKIQYKTILNSGENVYVEGKDINILYNF
jgi:hypothetical protein